MKIGITCYPTFGGSGILATRLGVEMAKRGHEIHFITYERPVALHGVDPENVNLHLVSVYEYPLFKYPPYTMALASEMARVTERHDLDLLHVHYSVPHAIAACIAKEMTEKPYVTTLHGSDVTLVGSDASYMPVNIFSVERSDAVTSVSKYMANEAKRSFGIENDIKVIPNFVDHELYAPAPCEVIERNTERDVVITHVSNFRPVKRIHDLIYAMRMVSKKAPETRLMLVGDGPDRHDIERLIERLDLRHNVLLTGYRTDVANLFKCSDVVVLSSETESAPLTLLEGMSTGLPAVATSVGGVPEIIDDGVNGFLVEPKNPEELAERILELNNDKTLRQDMGNAAREKILNYYTADKVVGQYLDVYERLT